MRLTLSACPPFSLSAVVKSHGWADLLPFGRDAGTGGLTRVERLASGRVVEMFVQEEASGVSVEVHDRLSGAEHEEVAHKVE